jgi:hypothetical protein
MSSMIMSRISRGSARRGGTLRAAIVVVIQEMRRRLEADSRLMLSMSGVGGRAQSSCTRAGGERAQQQQSDNVIANDWLSH